MSKKHPIGRSIAPLLITGVLLAGCSSVPKAVRTPIAGPDVGQTQHDPQTHLGRPVRWGGTIVELDNQADYTDIQIVSRNLERDGRPRDLTSSKGRFIARVNRFLEPTDYETGRQITVIGSLGPPVSGKIGEHAYLFPLVEVTELHLWAPEVAYPPGPYYWPYADPWWYRHRPLHPFDPYYWHRPRYRDHFRPF